MKAESLLIFQDYTDEQLAHGVAQLRAIRADLGSAASDESICGVIYDGMMYPLRKAIDPNFNATDASHEKP